MAYKFLKFTGKVDRRSPHGEGKIEDPIVRENLLARDDILKKPRGTERALTDQLGSVATWEGRYYSIETGVVSPKSFLYTQDGKLYHKDGVITNEIKTDLNKNAYPNHWLFKIQTQTIMYFVDGRDLYKYDGNNDNIFNKIDVKDVGGKAIDPIDIIEHKDRSFLISETFLYVSKNLAFDVFNDATDSIQLVVGSGKGKNLAIRKIEDRLYILNTEGIFALIGDTISAVAITFAIRLVDDKRIIAGRSAVIVEKAINFLADDYNVWSWNGSVSTKLSHSEKLEDFIGKTRDVLDRAVGTYEDNFYKLSFVEKGQTVNRLEWWWDAFENKGTFIRNRNVSYYQETDPTRETEFFEFTRSDIGMVMSIGGYNFDNNPIIAKLLTRDATVEDGLNVRFMAFYPKIEPIADREMNIEYRLDGRTGSASVWSQSMQGETIVLGHIKIKAQNQVTYRVRPKINFAKGESIAFYFEENTKDLRLFLLGIRIEYLVKHRKKFRQVGG